MCSLPDGCTPERIRIPASTFPLRVRPQQAAHHILLDLRVIYAITSHPDAPLRARETERVDGVGGSVLRRGAHALGAAGNAPGPHPERTRAAAPAGADPPRDTVFDRPRAARPIA